MFLLLAGIESQRALSWNWRWHRFWYLLEFSKNSKLREGENKFARLQVQSKPPEISTSEIIVDNKRQDLLEAVQDLIAAKETICRVLIVGEPGSGKTTGLMRVALNMAKKGSLRLGAHSKMPILVPLGNFQKQDLMEYIAAVFAGQTPGNSGAILSKGLENLLRKGAVVLLFDALDEALGERYNLVLSELDKLLKSEVYQKTPMIITSRTRETPFSRLMNLGVLELQDLSDDAVHVFVHALKPSGVDARDILQRLQINNMLVSGGIGRNPFWLGLIVANGAFAENKGQIINAAVDALLLREWEGKSRTERSWMRILPKHDQLNQTKLGLAWLGYQMSISSQTRLSRAQAYAILQDWLNLREKAGLQCLKPQDIIELGLDAQILAYSQDPIFFRHRLLQEFATAWMLNNNESLLEKETRKFAADHRWWETFLLLGGLLSRIESADAFAKFIRLVMGSDGDEQRLVVALGLLNCTKSLPPDLARSVILAFAGSVKLNLTESQMSAARKLEQEFGDEALEAFNLLFSNDEPRVKTKGAALLCALNSEKATTLICRALHDKNRKQDTTRALTRVGKLAVEKLLSIITENNTNDVRCCAAEALGEIGDPRAVNALIAQLHESDKFLRAEACAALGKIGASAVVPLINGLQVPDIGFRNLVAETLALVGAPAVPALVDIVREPVGEAHSHAAYALVKIGAPATEALVKVLEIKDEKLQARVEQILLRIGAPAVKALFKAAADSSNLAFCCAQRVLDQMAIPVLIEAIHDQDKDFCAKMEAQLLKMGAPAFEPVRRRLISIMNHTAKSVYPHEGIILATLYYDLMKKIDHNKPEVEEASKVVRFLLEEKMKSFNFESVVTKVEANTSEDIRPRVYGFEYTQPKGKKVYYFILVKPEKEQLFLETLEDNQEFDLKDFGEILVSGFGDVPEYLKLEMKRRFNVNINERKILLL